jgi:hypothetical protein
MEHRAAGYADREACHDALADAAGLPRTEKGWQLASTEQVQPRPPSPDAGKIFMSEKLARAKNLVVTAARRFIDAKARGWL